MEGFQTDIKLLRKRLKEVEKQLYRVRSFELFILLIHLILNKLTVRTCLVYCLNIIRKLIFEKSLKEFCLITKVLKTI